MKRQNIIIITWLFLLTGSVYAAQLSNPSIVSPSADAVINPTSSINLDWSDVPLATNNE